MSIDRPDEENEGQDAFTVDERPMTPSDDVTVSDIAAEGLELPPPE